MTKNETTPDPILRIPQEGDIPEVIDDLGQKARALWSESKLAQMEADSAEKEFRLWHDAFVAKQAEVKHKRLNAEAAWAAYCQYRFENRYTAPEPLEARTGEVQDLANSTIDVAEFFEELTKEDS